MLRGMSEAELLDAVRDLARLRGGITYHTYRSTRSEPGWPDLVVAFPAAGRVIFAELKTDRGQLTGPQEMWLDALTRAGLEVYVWRPRDLRSGAIARALNNNPRTPISKER